MTECLQHVAVALICANGFLFVALALPNAR
jgi:hypothetical protein